MTRDEFKILVKGMKAVYSSEKFIPDQDAFNVWFELLKDLPYEVVSSAIKQYMITGKFAPTIAEIRGLATATVMPKVKDASEAWRDVMKAVHKHGYYNQQKVLDSLEPLTKEAAERFGVRDLCDMQTEDISIARAQFMKIYDQIVNRRKQDAVMPIGMHDEIARLQNETLARLETKKEA